MTTSRNGDPSRPGSSRAASVVREIMKRREKPYKTEKQRVLTKKRKLELHTSYRNAPDGYIFVPVGTPDLSEKCKELSRQAGFAVNVVNAAPVSKHAVDPEKISHHIHRIGYHFKAEMVAQACEELGYLPVRGNFVKEADLQAQSQQSHIARIMAQHGIHVDPTTARETPAQVRAAIKELFPRIPNDDLDQIVQHAWEEGSQRVGTNAQLNLPRRVQLAVIARIRHRYTDYDRLLRAFEWREARSIIEQECLKKLIEWRGENEDEGGDDELEEIVRETIVIDDDDEDSNRGPNGNEADDEDSELEIGETSDTSIEFTHHVTAVEDFGAESLDERPNNFFRRVDPRALRTEQQNNIAREKIGAARQQLRNNQHAPPPAEVESVTVRTDERGLPSNTILVDGRIYHLDPNPTQQPPRPVQGYGTYGHQFRDTGSRDATQAYAVPAHQPALAQPIDYVMPSIEGPESVATRGPYHPTTPDRGHIPKRRRTDYSPHQQQPAHAYQATYSQAPRSPRMGLVRPARGEVIDLTIPHARRSNEDVIDLTESPPRHHHLSNQGPMRETQPTTIQNYPHGLDGTGFSGSLRGRPSAGPRADDRDAARQSRMREAELEPEPYDPTRPWLDLSSREHHRGGNTDFPRPYQTAATAAPSHVPQHTSYPTYNTFGQPLHNTYSASSNANPPQQQPSYYYAHQQPQASQYHGMPPPPFQPIHGAPAPVQQAPFDGRNAAASTGPQNLAPPPYMPFLQPPPSSQPMHGAPHPAQYYSR